MNKLLSQQVGETPASLSLLLGSLPPLPSVVRYQDDFDDLVRSLARFPDRSVFQLVINGMKVSLDFSRFNPEHEVIAKHVFLYLVANDFSISTAYGYLVALRDIGPDTLTEMLLAGPSGVKQVWAKLFARTGLSRMTLGLITNG